MRATTIGALAALLTWGAASPTVWADEEKPAHSITVKVSDKTTWTYTRAQLLDMATETLPNRTGTRNNPAIPLSKILFKDTGLSADQVQMVFLIGIKKIVVLRGNDLAYLDRLVLKSGLDKAGQPHPWALAPKDDEAYRAVAAHMGSPRKKEIYRIDILPKIQTGG